MTPLGPEERLHIGAARFGSDFLRFGFGLLLSIGHPVSHCFSACSVIQFRLAKHGKPL